MLRVFIQDCLAGKATPDEIDDYIDYWHTDGTSLTLAEHLGMTDEEYKRWVEDSDSLDSIIEAHKAFSG